MPRHAEVRVDTAAIVHNVGLLASLAGDALLCAVVKADGYGHGAVRSAEAALRGGADRLAVALVEEGVALREAGIDAPILLLSEPPADSLRDAFAHRLTPTLYHRDSIGRAAEVAGSARRWRVHLKVDTGMHRVGAAPSATAELAAEVLASPELELGGVFTHLAVADEPTRPETDAQLASFAAVLDELAGAGIDAGLRHAANSAGLIAHPASVLDMVRTGIAIYGIAPSPELADSLDLRPAMSVHAQVTHLLTVPAGEGVSYGLRHRFDRPTRVAVVPLGYADGVPRNLGLLGGEVLIGGIRRPIRGAVTMDQSVVELGPADDVEAMAVGEGDEVVLIGEQSGPRGVESIGAQEWADRLGTIAYEVVCGFGPRLPRVEL